MMEFFVDLDNVKAKEKTYLTHNYHPYPAKYIPQIPAGIMEKYLLEKDALVLDPFAGSGTTLVEAIVHGHKAIGVDSNPISVLISKAKTTPLNFEERASVSNLLDELSDLIILNNIEVELPEFKNRDHWFQKNMLIELTVIKNLVNKIKNDTVKNFLLCGLSSIVVKCSNQENDTRYAAKNKNLEDGYAYKEFVKKINDMLNRNIELSKIIQGETFVKQASSTNLDFIENDTVDIVITSPPYLNSYDYYLYHKLRMFILDLDHKEAQNVEIGSRNKHSDHSLGPEVYFESMRQVGLELYRVMKYGGKCIIVVGDSIVNKQLIDMSIEYNKIFKDIGFDVIESFAFDQRKYTTAFIKKSTDLSKKTHILVYQK